MLLSWSNEQTVNRWLFFIESLENETLNEVKNLTTNENYWYARIYLFKRGKSDNKINNIVDPFENKDKKLSIRT